MNWIKRNWYVLVLLLAIVATTAFADHESAVRDRNQASALITGCESGSRRAALAAQGWHVLAERVRGRNAPGDAISAAEYQAVADGLTDEVVRPEHTSPVEVVQVRRVVDAGKTKFILTDAARELQHQGCVDRYR